MGFGVHEHYSSMSSSEEPQLFYKTQCYKHQEYFVYGTGICEICDVMIWEANHDLCMSCSNKLKKCIRCKAPSFSGFLEQILPVVTYLVLEMNVPLNVAEVYVYTAFISS